MTNAPQMQPGRDDADAGIWCEIAAADFSGRPALFLDRDGVVVEDTGYLGCAENMRMLDGAAAAIVRCNRLGIPVVLVSNQSGIGRRLYDWDGFHAVQAALNAKLAEAGGHIDAALACAHHADGHAPLNIADHSWRKPNPGMILAASAKMKLALSRSWIVGDRVSDLAAGRAAQLEGGILLSETPGDPERTAALKLKNERFRVDACAGLDEAVALLLSQGRLGFATPHRGTLDSSVTGSRPPT